MRPQKLFISRTESAKLITKTGYIMPLFLSKSKKYLITTIIAFTVTLSQSALATPKDAGNFINDLAERVIAIVKKTDTSPKDKEQQLNAIFVQSVDTKWIGKFAMGKYWRNITPHQQSQFLDLYSNYLTGLYVPNFRKYTGNIVKVINASEIRANEYLVQTELTDELNTMNIKINYRLQQKDTNLESFVIFDVIAEGVSLITTQRSEINAAMDNGDFNSLVTLLVKKTGAMRK